MLESFQMLVQLENAARIQADSLENSIPVKQTMIENRNFRILFLDELSV